MRKLICLALTLLFLCPAALAEEPAFDPSLPMVALTFDDGPSEYTPEMLDVLAENGCRATFFLVGTHMEAMPEMVQLIAETDNEIGTHTWKHEHMNEQTDYYMLKNLQNCLDLTMELTGRSVQWLRPPYGIVSGSAYYACRRLGLYMVNWSIDSEDWQSRDPKKIVQTVMQQVENGAVILCHETYPTTVEAMKTLLPVLREAGYQLVTISELFSRYDGELKPNTFYYKVDPQKMKKD